MAPAVAAKPAGKSTESRRDGKAPAGTGYVRIISPDSGQTFANFDILHQRLLWSKTRQELRAQIRFSNLKYTDRLVRREDDLLDFRLPGARLDPATGIITAPSSTGSRVVIGRYVNQVLGTSILFAPYAFVTIYHSHGRINVALTANPRTGPVDLHWQVRGREMSWRKLFD
ncbi:hypothetical protein DB346_19080 [Verrucomicrobia bacterium LW23]|nr:hypothetical protein DB346_19080 [Verrucomicrobia bacterium LW23]